LWLISPVLSQLVVSKSEAEVVIVYGDVDGIVSLTSDLSLERGDDLIALLEFFVEDLVVAVIAGCPALKEGRLVKGQRCDRVFAIGKAGAE
jgi:hypothetical protein